MAREIATSLVDGMAVVVGECLQMT